MKNINNLDDRHNQKGSEVMNRLNYLISVLVAGVLIGCSKGSSSTPSSINNTQYDLQNYLFDVGVQSNNCIHEGSSVLSCDSKGIFGGVYSINFNIPDGKPGAYVVMPPLGNNYGLNITPISGCRQTAHHGKGTYICNFTIMANGTAQAGKMLHFKLSGDLGEANIITIKIR